MKNLIRLLVVAVALAFAGTVRANVGQTTGLSTVAKQLVVPGVMCKVVIIQNNGTSDIRISLDGGAAYTDYATGKTGTNPTASTGYLLKAGAQLTITMLPQQGGLRAPIIGIMVSGSTTLDFVTDDYQSTFPTA